MHDGAHISDFTKEDDRYALELITASDVWLMYLSVSSFTVEWDAFCGMAWYESDKKLVLSTPNGDRTVIAHLQNRDPEEAFTVCLSHQDVPYQGIGKSGRFEEAFADLQNKLPTGVFLKCCLTCVHGNFCPYGDDGIHVFCTKGDSIPGKIELCEILPRIASSMERHITFLCEGYEKQAKDRYTYSDFRYYLKKDF